MSSESNPVSLLAQAARLLVTCALLSGTLSAQTIPNRPTESEKGGYENSSIPDATNRLKDEPFLVQIRELAKAGATQAIPDLVQQFSLTPAPNSKGAIASALVRLGDNDPAYWDYLVQRAEAAIHDDAPYVVATDAGGKPIPAISDEFESWAKHRGLTTDNAQERVLGMIGSILDLGEAADRRAIPLLRQALLSRNIMVQKTAAQELAQLHDNYSIPFIIEACRRAPSAVAELIASFSLPLFDDPVAQSAFKEFVPRDPGAKDTQ